MRRGLHAVIVVSGTAAIYWVAARLALSMAIPPGYATAVWPASGLALICVLVWGPRAAIGVALGSCAVNVGTSFDATSALAIARSFGIAGAIAGGAATQASFGAALIRTRIGFPSALHDERDIAWFIVLGGPLACLVSSTTGVTTLSIAGVVPWSSFGFDWWTWWVGDTIGVLVFAPLALLAIPTSHQLWRRRRSIVGIPLVLGFAAVTLLFLRVSGWERVRLRTDLERRVIPVEAALKSQLSKYEEVVASLASYFEASDEVTRREFQAFCTRPLANHPAILALSWNPRVRAAQRAEFEERARADGLIGFSFTEQTQTGELHAADPRPEYVPVYYVEPPRSNVAVLGYDIASDPLRRAALERVTRFSDLATTQGISLVQDAGDTADPRSAGILLIAPVFGRSTPRDPVGYAVGAFRVRNLVETALHGIHQDGLAIRLVDRSTDDTGAVLYTTEPDVAPSPEVDQWTFPVGFGDRRWQLEISPTIAAFAMQRSWQAWTVLAAGLLFVGLLGVVLLITTGRTFRLHESSERFRALVEASAQIVRTTDASGELTDDSPSWSAFTGQTAEQARGDGRIEAIHPEDREAMKRDWQQAAAEKAAVDTEYRIRHVSGEWRWTAARGIPLLDANRDIRGWIISNTDITERKRAADQFRVAIDAAPTGMIMVDRTGCIALVNSQVEKVFGYSRNELIGSPVEILVPARLRGQHPDHRAGFFRSPGARPMGAERDLHGVRKDGTEVPIEIGLNPLLAGDQPYVLCSIVDITERKRAEADRERFLAELTRLNAELELRVQSRTSELTAALREREVLLQEVHHRVKNNLQVISSLINMQVRKLDHRADRDALEECQTRVQAIALIHEKLYQSRDYANVPFSEYTRTLVSNVFHTMGVSLASIELDMAIEDVAVPVDKAIPCGLLLNELITNALKHAFKDGRRGELRVELVKLGDRLRLVVKDNGVGLPTGLDVRGTESFGLQLVMTLVEQLDATLAVADHGGACFELNFAVEN